MDVGGGGGGKKKKERWRETEEAKERPEGERKMNCMLMNSI
jgi:hypothetical protein